MIGAWIDGIGIFAPGLVGWEQARAVLAGAQPYVPAPAPKLAPALLPADVRRRTTDHIRLAVEVGAEAVRQAAVDAGPLWSVFSSSDSDGVITHNICEEVARETPEVSPTRFHNSVNNAPAGYWCMAVGSRAPSTSICAFDASFAAGLLEACAQVVAEQSGVLYVVYDTPMPEPLNSVRPMTGIFGAAFVLAPQRSARSLARITLAIEPRADAMSRLADRALDGMRTGNAAARALPLLAALARGTADTLTFPYVHSQALRATLGPA
ncbi:MAG: beta-ketoacyl synthase chain length factor [Comamonadaceae bacterium]|nr:beta-ketoacyl synthase chain length factor [Comamonadaceae bacterium]